MGNQKRKGCLKRILLLCAFFILCLALYAGAFSLRLTRAAPAADAAFRWPYYLFTPLGVDDNRISKKPIHLLVLPNNTGTTSDDPSDHDRAALAGKSIFQLFFGDMDVAILTPTFPRPETGWEAYTQALDRDTLATDLPGLQRIDLQLEAMIDDAAERLTRQGWTVDRKVLMFGFSASGMFVNRFTVLHPDRVLAAAVGSPGGWPIAPVSEWQGRYPEVSDRRGRCAGVDRGIVRPGGFPAGADVLLHRRPGLRTTPSRTPTVTMMKTAS